MGSCPDLAWLRTFVNACGIATGTRRFRQWERVHSLLVRGAAATSAARPGTDQPVEIDLDRFDGRPMLSLLDRCLVRVEQNGRCRGTGFFVAAGEVLTCADLMRDDTELEVVWQGTRFAATVSGEPLADGRIVRLRLHAGPPAPCVQLTVARPTTGPGAALHCTGWVVDQDVITEPALTSVTADIVGSARNGLSVTFRGAAVLDGLDGAPLLDLHTGEVPALVCGGKGPGRPVGVLIEAVAADAPDLLIRNRLQHAGNSPWQQAWRRERELIEVRIASRDRLPLLAPQLELDWDTEGSRVDLLHPRYAVVPYLGRTQLLANLMRWREDRDPVRVAVLSGPGGLGKTRTAIEVCAAAERAGWTGGLLGLTHEHQPDQVAALGAWPGPLLVAVDYAETRPRVVAELLLALRRRPATRPARVVLITRQITTRQALRELFGTGDGGADLAGVLERADVVRLAHESVDPRALFELAATVFAGRLGRSRPERVPDLTADHFARPLYVLTAALLKTEEPGVDVDDIAAEDLLRAILDRHEAEYWDRWNQRLGTSLSRDDQRRAVAWAALLGGDTEADALAMVAMLPGFADASNERLRQVARWLAHLYGAGRLDERPAVTPLEPDLLAEALIASVVTNRVG